MSYQTKSAVLFIIFNRPDTTKLVFEQIAAARPPRLYIAADGPRADKANEAALCEEARVVASLVNWPCEVKTLFREKNLGCKNGVASAIDWFFGQEEEGIILEDDCLPAESFFRFCDHMLSKYRHDTRVRHIGGSNLQRGKTWGAATYYFSNLTHVWGWASWRRVWQDYDKELGRYSLKDVRQQLSNIFSDPFILDTWEDIFKQLKAGQIDTWDYQLTFTNFFNNSLSVIPNFNLITNIGYGAAATHTTDPNNPYANIPLEDIPSDILNPVYVQPEKRADYNTLEFDFNLKARYKKYNKPSRRFKRWLKGER
ncbi:nucleotide-diphospho-sugar transferase [Mucilaginibacter sp. RS28]|uniref:Nucleotide-diphospho-sugar transferase n=1 Tax=Mucilaginibacter straminoryzae TaxID=2932774 RepID=A0A9X2BBM1_9SPHI|nr:nucleotide-diphospho-sugar transferase [Mucilaginibacter straminoryzae]MCJ8208428.1 nucleotide-diphospho-sugar transferase [Mucilaginibacter straminoryzae]